MKGEHTKYGVTFDGTPDEIAQVIIAIAKASRTFGPPERTAPFNTTRIVVPKEKLIPKSTTHRIGRPPKEEVKCSRCGTYRLKSDLVWRRCKEGCIPKRCNRCKEIVVLKVGGICEKCKSELPQKPIKIESDKKEETPIPVAAGYGIL